MFIKEKRFDVRNIKQIKSCAKRKENFFMNESMPNRYQIKHFRIK